MQFIQGSIYLFKRNGQFSKMETQGVASVYFSNKMRKLI